MISQQRPIKMLKAEKKMMVRRLLVKMVETVMKAYLLMSKK